MSDTCELLANKAGNTITVDEALTHHTRSVNFAAPNATGP